MIRLRHILHPVCSAKSLYRKVSSRFRKMALRLYRRLSELKFRKIQRGQRNQCWCGGALLPFKWHSSFGVCGTCGCYVNRRPPLLKELRRFYTFDTYWHSRMKLKGYPTIENRAANDLSDGRVQRWLDVIKQFGPPKGRVIEVGCAHGVLLAELVKRGYDCIGVEVDEKTAAWTRQKVGIDVRVGIFPDIELPDCDLFMAYDVLEHSLYPDRFLRHAARLLKPGGIAVIQTPIDRVGSGQPFPEIFDELFDDIEHLYIFTKESINELAENADLEIIAEARGVIDIDINIFRKKEQGDA